jgi:stage II sporulation protein D
MAEEEYVAAVLREEGTSSMPREALKALAVCVRTYAERCRGRHASEGFDLCGTTHCQCFGGVDAAAGWAQVAARETRGQVLQQQGRPIFAVYSTDCGGSTANNEDVGLGSSPWPYLRSTRDAPTDGGAEYCGAGRYHRWELVVTREELERRLNTRAESRVGRLTALALEAPDTWGRPTRFRATGEATPKAIPQCAGTLPEHKGTGAASEVVRVLPMARLRQLLGEARLKSTFAEVSVLPSGSLRFRGRGYGHGAGLCMTGAVGMASAPFLHRYNEILEHYYQGAELVSLVPAAPSPPEWQGAVEQ